MSITVSAPEALDGATGAAVTALVARCNVAEGLDLAIVAEINPETGLLLASLDGELAGAATIRYGHDSEVYLCVEPALRRRGVGRALALAARERVLARGSGQAIFVTDMAAESGRAFTAAVGARLDYAEHQLDLDPAAVPADPPPLPGLAIRPGQPSDAPAIIAILMAAFNDPPEIVEPFVAERLGAAGHHFLLAELDGRAVGTLRLVGDGDWVYVTTFGVLPELHGRGVGRRLLLHVVGTLRGRSSQAIRIEVDVNNAPALGLYESCGFRRSRTYAYMLLPEVEGVTG